MTSIPQVVKEALAVRTEDLSKFNKILGLLDKSQDESKVVALTSSFGSGKTFFIENLLKPFWENNEKYKNIFYFNAWQYDVIDDPLEGFLNELIENLSVDFDDSKSQQAKKITQKITSWVTKPLQLGGDILGVAASALIGVEPSVASVLGSTSVLAKGLASTSDSIKNAISEPEITTINRAKIYFQKLIDLFDLESKPILIIIDELERCKPDYVLHFLEYIKHLMCLGNIHFVISVDVSYLKSAISHFYGAEINPADYLRKFFIAGYQLSNIKMNDYEKFLQENNPNKEINKLISVAAKATQSDLRTIERFLYFFKASFHELEHEIFDYDSWDSSEPNAHLKKLLAYLYVYLFFMSYKERETIDQIKNYSKKHLTDCIDIDGLNKKFKNFFVSVASNWQPEPVDTSFSILRWGMIMVSLNPRKNKNITPEASQSLQDRTFYAEMAKIERIILNSEYKALEQDQYFIIAYPFLNLLISSIENSNFLI